MTTFAGDVVVAGHICLDLIPRMESKGGSMDGILQPGKLVEVGAALISTGGAVSNTGIALHRLGVHTSLMGKVGDDLFGKTILNLINVQGKSLADGMIIALGEATSYTVVISPPDVDRVFLHCTGANDTFTADDLRLDIISGAKLFHFGYPPLMRNMFENEGRELARLLFMAKREGVTVSLDMANPDPESDAGKADWPPILRRSMPHVDLFMPSFEEIFYALRKDRYLEIERANGPGGVFANADGLLLRSLADELIDMGAAVVVLKLGEHGLYLRTTSDAPRIKSMGMCAPEDMESWRGRELLSTCFEVKPAGTTGAGDCTIAGFLRGVLAGDSPEEVLNAAVAVGACNVECADAVSGVPSWETVRVRMQSGWARRENKFPLPGWISREEGIWIGPEDRSRIG